MTSIGYSEYGYLCQVLDSSKVKSGQAYSVVGYCSRA